MSTGTDMSSSGSFGTSSASTASGCQGQITCAQKGFNCGMVGDGCGNAIDCGDTCPTGQSCGGGNMPNVCGAPACMAKTCMDLGFNCGMASDGCNGTLDCGTCMNGQTCGSTSANVCGTTICTPKTCMDLGFSCGMQGDTCGNTLNCGSCPTGQTCGGGGTPGICGIPPCTPKTCAQQGFNCGMATDTCNGIINCGPTTCGGGNQVCGGNMPNVCGTSASCTGLCLQQQTCPTGTTSISGTVFAPNQTDPVYNTLVYVPNGGSAPTYGVQAFPTGISCGACGLEVTGTPLVSTTTDVHGVFSLTNMPVGTNIPLVIQNGRWRRKITIPNVPACVNTALTAAQTRFPKTEAEGDPADNIPLMGFVTGSVDALECVLRKIGIADSQFSDPTGSGRVRFYLGNGSPGATYSGSTPLENSLWGSQATINKYDMVYFACQGAEYDKSAAAQNIVINYANAGGRVFGTHYSYVWLFNDAPFSSTATWQTEQSSPTPDPQTGYINQTFPKGLALAQWLKGLYPASTQGQISINTLRHDFNNVAGQSSLWISLGGRRSRRERSRCTTPSTRRSARCRRTNAVAFSTTTSTSKTRSLGGVQFPQECTNGTMTQQEKMLEFMIFDLGSCVAPPTCTAKTCMAQGAQCGPIGDGCGNIEQCGACPTGQNCVNNQCVGCTPKTCMQEGFMCGNQGDGCGNVENCGMCPVGQNCVNGTCQVGMCTPKTCTQQNFNCGAQGDGCGNIEMCGTCMNNQQCTNGTCVTQRCTPKTCQELGFNCGQASDGCNNIINCGSCAAGQTCGGGTPPVANVCGGSA